MRALRKFAATSALVAALTTSSAPAWASSTAKPPAPATSTTHHSGGAQEAGEIIGFIGLVGILIAWSEGYGLLGGRNRRGSQPPAAGADNPEA